MKKSRKKVERGSSILESLIAICLLLFLFLSMLQIFQWVSRQMVSDYAAFYASKALSLGYAGENCRKATRVAAIGMSGQDFSSNGLKVNLGDSRSNIRHQAEIYMRQGQGSGVDYEYWGYNSDANLSFNFDYKGDSVGAVVRLRNAPLLVPAMGKLLGFDDEKTHPVAYGSTTMYNYAGDFLDE